jgi:nicotinamidase-related amidase
VNRRIAHVLAAWRAAGAPVVHATHLAHARLAILAGAAGRPFQADFTPLAHEHVQEKNVPDAFIHSGLERWLRGAASKRW